MITDNFISDIRQTYHFSIARVCGRTFQRVSKLTNAKPSNSIIFKTISATIAITFTYFGNSRWTFKTRTGREPGLRRIVLYGVINIFGSALTVLPLYVSWYVLVLESLLADNISVNIIGVGLALVFGFVMNRQIVFLDEPQNLNNSQLR